MGMVFTGRGGTRYACPASLKEVTIRKFVQLVSEVEPKMPAHMKSILEAQDAEERQDLIASLEEHVYAGEFLPYMARVVSVMCEVPYEEIMGTDGQGAMNVVDVELLYANCMGCFGGFEEKNNFKGFEFKGTHYRLPEQFMEKSTVIEYMEASQYQHHYSKLKEGTWGALPYVVAVLARPEGEQYNEENVLLRGEEFKELNMEAALQVSFFLMRQCAMLNKSFLYYSLLHRTRQLKQGLEN